MARPGRITVTRVTRGTLALALALALVLPSTLAIPGASAGSSTSVTRILGDEIHFQPSQLGEWDLGLVPVGDNSSAFGIGGDASVPSTLGADEVPWTEPIMLGVNYLRWTDPELVPMFSDAFEVGSTLRGPGTLGGPRLDATYLVGTFVMGDDIPFDFPRDYFAQFDLVLDIPGREKWQALEQFPDDTWHNGSLVLSLRLGFDATSFDVYSFAGGNIVTEEHNGFAFVDGDAVVMGFEVDDDTFPQGRGGIQGRLALDVRTEGFPPEGHRVVTAPSVPLDANGFFPYLGMTRVLTPGYPGMLDFTSARLYEGADGNMLFGLTPRVPWDGGPPTGFFSDFLRVGYNFEDQVPSVAFGFQTHDGVDETFKEESGSRIASPGFPAFVTEDGEVIIGTDLRAATGDGYIFVQSGFLRDESSPFQSRTDLFPYRSSDLMTWSPDSPGSVPVYDLAAGTELEPLPTTTTTPVATTLAGAEPVDGAGGSSLVLVGILIAVVLLIFLLWRWFASQTPSDDDIYRFGPTRERGRPGAGDEEDDDTNPRDTPPPVVYGEEMEEHGACGWGLYFHDGTREIPLREPEIHQHLCCKYVVRVTTDVRTHVQAARGRQDAGAERLRIPDLDYDWRWVDLKANTSARSGPAGRLDWMQGLGNPNEQAELASDDGYWQQAQGEELPEVAAHLYHREVTEVDITLEPGCPEYKNVYSVQAESQLHVLATHECTNDASDPCPVELNAFGFVGGWIRGPGNLFTGVADMTGTDPDELERSPRAESDERPAPRPPWDGHDHAARDRLTYERSADDSAIDALERDDLLVSIENDVEIDAGQIVPVAAYPTTERVSAHIEGELKHDLQIQVDLTPIDCGTNGCGGHGPCDCKAEWTMRISETGGSWIDGGKGPFEILRQPTGGDRREPATGRKSWTGKS